VIVRLIIIGLVSLPDYDIRICHLAGVVCLAAAPASSPLGQLRRQAVPDRDDRGSLLTDGIGAPPVIRIVGEQLRGEHVTFFGRARAACNPLHQLGITLAEALGVGRADGLPQRGVIIGNFAHGGCRAFRL
jgi:hypothetical protein